jgi:hypothetical protein
VENFKVIRKSITDLELGDGPNYLIQSCNNIGAYGAGVSGVISKKWPLVESFYRKKYLEYKDYTGQSGLPMGLIMVVEVESNLSVVNIIGQEGLRSRSNPKPVRWGSISIGLNRLLEHYPVGTYHLPLIGCGLGGGKEWELMEVLKVLPNANIYRQD